MAGDDRQTLRGAISPCPNDTFVFRGAIAGGLTLPETDISWSFEDVETLNRAALHGTFDITKLSFHAYLAVRDRYTLLRAGAALGFGCGPVVVAREPISKDALSGMRIVLPGEWTTAHLLFRLFAPHARRKQFVRYDRIIPSIVAGEADAGVIIHEDRFVFQRAGLYQVADLGQWWESETGAPIPLGCIAVKQASAARYGAALEQLIRRSLTESRQNPEGAMPFVMHHAQQLEPEVVRQHIDMFVNDFSFDLGEEGEGAIRSLEAMAKEAGILT